MGVMFFRRRCLKKRSRRHADPLVVSIFFCFERYGGIWTIVPLDICVSMSFHFVVVDGSFEVISGDPKVLNSHLS